MSSVYNQFASGNFCLEQVWELFSAAVITATTGFMWGAVAGAWSSIFQANQLAGQKFNEKMTNLKEFCRIKGLDWGTRSKLVAYYEHLHPERVSIQ
jgi:nitrogen fixation protein FixH